ncbi:MAG: DUF58 domain-containing protein [Lachnospiraceae bacterium]|nr:DUF58 domain-containing protein [Lachnospiraceae bacterium]
MRMRYISRIQANLKRYQIIYSRKATANVLDGSYKSVFKGRSMNFDELREYVPGDEIKDMDWKASARNRKLYVREYVAEKKHNVMFVLDTNARMLGDSERLEEKRELAIMSAGTLAFYVDKNGDFVGAIYGTFSSINHFPLKTGLGNIETILENYHNEVVPGNNSDINNTLDYIVRNFRRKTILIIVTDLEGVLRISDVNIKRLLVAHDVLVVNVSDADIAYNKMYNIGEGTYMPDFFLKDKKLVAKAKENKLNAMNAMHEKLKKFGIPYVTIDDFNEIERELMTLLSSHRGGGKQ